MKNLLRQRILKDRKGLSIEEVNSKSLKISNKLFSLKEYKNSSCVMLYLDFSNEVSTIYILDNLLNSDRTVVVPISIKSTKELLLSELQSLEDLFISTYGIREPKGDRIIEILPNSVDIILVPGVVFDRQGYRIGYGGGYYDRFFSSLSHNFTTIGLCYDLQLVEEVPREDHDYKLDYIITEKEIINCK